MPSGSASTACSSLSLDRTRWTRTWPIRPPERCCSRTASLSCSSVISPRAARLSPSLGGIATPPATRVSADMPRTEPRRRARSRRTAGRSRHRRPSLSVQTQVGLVAALVFDRGDRLFAAVGIAGHGQYTVLVLDGHHVVVPAERLRQQARDRRVQGHGALADPLRVVADQQLGAGGLLRHRTTSVRLDLGFPTSTTSSLTSTVWAGRVALAVADDHRDDPAEKDEERKDEEEGEAEREQEQRPDREEQGRDRAPGAVSPVAVSVQESVPWCCVARDSSSDSGLASSMVTESSVRPRSRRRRPAGSAAGR